VPEIAFHKLSVSDGDPQSYNAGDCLGTADIWEKLNSLKHPRLIYDLERGVQALYLEMMLRGFRVDPLAREDGIRSVTAKLRAMDGFLCEMSQALIGTDVNYDSGKQLKELFYGFLRIPPIKKWVKGEIKEPMDGDTLEKLLRYPDAQMFARAVLSCRELDKELEKIEMEVDDDFRMRTSVNIAGTTEGRTSSSESFLGTGGNMQNVTQELRHMFIADDGWKLAGIDKEQAESRWVGFLCGILFGDWKYLDACESGDLHTIVSRLWVKDIDWTGDLAKDKILASRPFGSGKGTVDTIRQASKHLNHATCIMGKPPTIESHIGIPRKTVALFQEGFFGPDGFPAIPRLHTWIANKINATQFLTNPFGRRRDFFGRPDDDATIRKGMAFMQASPNADDIKIGMNRIWHGMGDRVQLLSEEHDAIYFQFRESDNEMEVITEAQKHLDVVFDLGFRKFSVPTEAKTGYNKGPRWKFDSSGNKIESNPRGLDKPGAKRNV